ncbi:MAG: hypothetical protein EXS37_00530 [Opitutus sp.]|nr:hypothetical protein [Opitutus sp.]
MSSNPAAGPLRAYRRAGKLVLEIDETRFCTDAFLQSQSRILDRDAFLAFACENLFELLHDDDDACLPTWWLRLSQAVGDEATNVGAGVRLNDGEDFLPINQPPDLFPDEITRALLGQHSVDTPVFPSPADFRKTG